jgi:hypothetical protein
VFVARGAVAIALGVGLAWIDSRPGFDATGVTARSLGSIPWR